MARPQRQTPMTEGVDEPFPLGTGIEAEETGAATLPADDLQSVLLQFGGLDGFYIRCYRYEKQGTLESWAFLQRYPASEFELDGFSQRYGPGRYKFVVCGTDGRARKHLQQLIGAPVASPSDYNVTREDAPRARADTAPSQSLIETLLLSQIKTQGDLLVALVSDRSRAGGAVSGADLLAAVKIGLESNAGRERQPFEPVLEAVKAGMDIASGGRSEDKSSGFESMGARVLTLLDHLLARGVPGAGPTVTPLGAPSRAPSPAAPARLNSAGDAAPAAPGAASHPLLSLAARYAPALLKEASRGRNPVIFGQFIADRCPEELLEPLHKLASVTSAERMSVLTTINPELAEHTKWLDEVCSGILDVIELEPEEVDHDAGGGAVRAAEDPTRGAGNLAERGGDPSHHPNGGAPTPGPGLRGPDLTAERTV